MPVRGLEQRGDEDRDGHGRKRPPEPNRTERNMTRSGAQLCLQHLKERTASGATSQYPREPIESEPGEHRELGGRGLLAPKIETCQICRIHGSGSE